MLLDAEKRNLRDRKNVLAHLVPNAVTFRHELLRQIVAGTRTILRKMWLELTKKQDNVAHKFFMV